jgi:hypothetical protein
MALGRAFHGRWHTHRGVGESQEFQRQDGDDGDGRDFRGQARTNDTHASTTDPDARLYRKSAGAEARLAYLGHVLMENRHGLGRASGGDTRHGDRGARGRPPAAAGARRRRRVHAGSGQELRHGDFVAQARALGDTPHVSQHAKRTGGNASTRARRGTTATSRVKPVARGSNGSSAGSNPSRASARSNSAGCPCRMALLFVRGLQRETSHGPARCLGGRMSPQARDRPPAGAAMARSAPIHEPVVSGGPARAPRFSGNSYG